MKQFLFLGVAFFAALGAHAAQDVMEKPVHRARTMVCEPPVLTVADADVGRKESRFDVFCAGVLDSLAPSVRFTGTLTMRGRPPYPINSSYVIDARSLASSKLDKEVRADQVLQGELSTSAVSAAALSSQFSAITAWDAAGNLMSIQEAAGSWRVFHVSAPDAEGEVAVTESGVASEAALNGKAIARQTLESRFAGKGISAPVIVADLIVRDGKLVVDVGQTRVRNAAQIQGALLSLDRSPKDISRAWALASRAQYLSLTDEVLYAAQRVAAYNPDMLEEFQREVAKIRPYSLQLK